MTLKALVTFAVSRPAWQIYLAGVLTLGGVGATWLHGHDARIRDGVHLTDSLAVLRTTTNRLEPIRVVTDTLVVHDSIRVSHTVARLDTLWRDVPAQIVTRAETVSVLDALPTIRRQTDSVTRACSELTVSCATYRITTDSIIAALHAQLVIVPKLAAVTATPSRWAIAERWGERLGIACLAYSLGARHLCWQR